VACALFGSKRAQTQSHRDVDHPSAQNRTRKPPQPWTDHAVLVEMHDEWQVSDGRYISESSLALLTKTEREWRTPNS
jgi:hypothetical protein